MEAAWGWKLKDRHTRRLFPQATAIGQAGNQNDQRESRAASVRSRVRTKLKHIRTFLAFTAPAFPMIVRPSAGGFDPFASRHRVSRLGFLEMLAKRRVQAVTERKQLDRMERALGDSLLHLHPAGTALRGTDLDVVILESPE